MIKTGQDADVSNFVVPLTAGEALSARDACYISPVDGKVYKCDADDTTKTNFEGFAQEAASSGASVNLVPGNLVPDFVGLTIGATYYLSGTAGAISATAGTYAIPVGIALSATVLKVEKAKRYASSVASKNLADASASTTTLTHGLGVTPRKLKVTAIFGTSSASNVGNHAYSFFTYDGVNSAGIENHFDSGNSAVAQSTGAISIYATTTAYQSGAITTFNSQTAVITWTKTNSPTGTAYLLWEAEA